MSETNPRESDLILGGHNPPPVTAAVLGGLDGKKQRLARKLGLHVNDELFDRFLNQLGMSFELAYELSQNHDICTFETVSINESGAIVVRTKKTFYYTEDLGDSVSLDMMYIPAGEFMMGSADHESSITEHPQHLVKLKAFYMARYPITQSQYKSVIAENPSNNERGEDFPVHYVSWNRAKDFCKKLSHFTGRTYDLPSESQWEYACCANTNKDCIAPAIITYNDKYPYRDAQLLGYNKCSTNVDTFPANNFGLHNMCANNFWEWCSDSWHDNYQDAPDDGSPWDNTYNSVKVLRGGSQNDLKRRLRSVNVLSYEVNYGYHYFGFRPISLNR